MTSVAVLGSLTRDVIIIQRRNARINQLGGGVYYTSLALASLGVSVVAMPLLAKKDEELLTALQHPRIKILPQWTSETTCYQNTYPGDSLDICEKKILAMAASFQPTKDLFNGVKNCEALHLAPLSSNEFAPSSFEKLRKNYAHLLSIDGQGFTRGPSINVQALLKGNVDIIKVDDEESRFLTNQDNEGKAAQTFASWGIREVIITKASRGSILLCEGKLREINPYPPKKLVDATGCGDAYIAGYLKKRLSKCSSIHSADFASKIAAKNLECQGALLEDLTTL